MRSRSSPAPSGVKVLKSGMIQVGATNFTTSVYPATAAQQAGQARLPACAKMARTAARSAARSTPRFASPDFVVARVYSWERA